MSFTQQQYDDAITWTRVAPQPVPTLPEYAQLAGAIGALKPVPAALVITQRPMTRPLAIVAALQADKFGHNNRVGWSDGNRYVREEQAIELKGVVTLCLFTEQVVLSPGVVGPMPFGFTSSIQFQIGNVLGQTTAISPAATEVRITVDTTTIPDGWYPVSVAGLPATWSVAECDMLVRNGTGPIATMPVRAGSYTTNEHGSRYSTCIVPAVFDPCEQPLPDREYPPWGTVTSMDQLVYTMLSPFRKWDVYRPGMLPNGVWTTANRQRYFYGDLQAQRPLWVAMSGRRGRGQVTCATSLRETGRPTGGKVTGTHPWGTFAVDNDGTVRLLSGYEHDPTTPPYTNAGQFTHWFGTGLPTLRGDWSAIPTARWGYHELWDDPWYLPSLEIDTTAPLIGGEPPHKYNPVSFPIDTQNGRICRQEFARADRSKPPKITEFVTGLGKPWNADFIGDVLYCTEQLGNRIQGYDVHTAAVVWSMPFTRPEGLRAYNGKLYVGSLASKSVSVIDPATQSVTKFCDVPCNANSNFVNLTIGDGTTPFLATVTWTNLQYGWPVVYDENGKQLTVIQSVSGGAKYTKGPVQPVGMSYVAAVSLGKGRMTWGTIQDGLHRVSWALPTDPTPSAAAIAGQKEYDDLDLALAYSDNAFHLYGVPFPFAKYGANVDAFVRSFGHS